MPCLLTTCTNECLQPCARNSYQNQIHKTTLVSCRPSPWSSCELNQCDFCSNYTTNPNFYYSCNASLSELDRWAVIASVRSQSADSLHGQEDLDPGVCWSTLDHQQRWHLIAGHRSCLPWKPGPAQLDFGLELSESKRVRLFSASLCHLAMAGSLAHCHCASANCATFTHGSWDQPPLTRGARSYAVVDFSTSGWGTA
jgi:hypothetical protein